MQQPYDWRDEPSRISVSSLVLLVIFVGAVAFTVYAAIKMEPWAADGPQPEVSADGGAQAAPEDVTPVPSVAPTP